MKQASVSSAVHGGGKRRCSTDTHAFQPQHDPQSGRYLREILLSLGRAPQQPGKLALG